MAARLVEALDAAHRAEMVLRRLAVELVSGEQIRARTVLWAAGVAMAIVFGR